ncbi:hypothetical protein FJZ31_00430 [Candidatus Poribacteria bacterium]|nr:hypothetical protein [Candidatus Poribacteria bacterium]
MMNFKQEEIVQQFFEEMQAEFPHIELVDIAEGYDGSVTIKVFTPEDDDWEIIEASGEKSMDILLTYGYHILFMPLRNAQLIEEMYKIKVGTGREKNSHQESYKTGVRLGGEHNGAICYTAAT